MKMVSIVRRVHDGSTDAGFLVSTLSLAIMVVIYCAEVVGRYFLNHPLDWSNDVFSNLLCVTLFAMVPHATRSASHIEINIVPEFLPKAGPPLKVLVNIVGFCVCMLTAWMSLGENMRQIAMGILTEQNHPVPVWWISIFITYGFASSALYFLRALIPGQALRPQSFLNTLESAENGGAG